MNHTNEYHVIFGTGPLGLAVQRELVKRGQRVRMVNRSGRANVASTVEVIAADVYDHTQARRAVQDAGVVYQCAQPEYHEWQEKFPPLQASILEATAAQGAKLIIADNLYAYGDAQGALITEDLPIRATGPKAKTRAQMAQAALDAHRAGRVRVAIARASDFYGPGVRGSAVGEMVFANAVQGKAAMLMGNIDLPHTYTYIDDYAIGLVVLGEHDNALGRVWHVPSAPTVTTREFVKMVFEEAGMPLKMQVAGRLMVRGLSLFMRDLRELLELEHEFIRPFTVDHSQFVRAYGNPARPMRDAIRATVAWYRDELKIPALIEQRTQTTPAIAE